MSATKKSVNWAAGAYLWITVASPGRDPYKTNPEHVKDTCLFWDWLVDSKINFKTNRIGAGVFDGLIEIDEWPKVKKWLAENGYDQGLVAIPRETEEE